MLNFKNDNWVMHITMYIPFKNIDTSLYIVIVKNKDLPMNSRSREVHLPNYQLCL